MTEDEKVRPYHARKAPSGQEAADAVADVLSYAAERDEAAKKKAPVKKQPKWMLPLGVNLAVLAVYLLIAPPSWAVLNPIQPPPVADQLEDMRTAIYFQAIVRIENYRQANGRLPATLQEAGSPLQGVDYFVRGDSAYQIVASIGDQVISFDSTSQTAADFAGDLSRKISG